MLKNNHVTFSNTPNPSFNKGTILKKVISFLEDVLLEFQKHCKGQIATAEEELNEELGKMLNYYSKDKAFIFQAETIQKPQKGRDRRVDIGAFMHYADANPFFTIEAKRLLSSFSKKREKEYVLGVDPKKISGGIERFKSNVHGVNLPQSALVGYVQDNDSKYWYGAINKWIRGLIAGTIASPLSWDSNDLLKNTCGLSNGKLAVFKSRSEKINKTKISLRHYFVNLCP